MEPLGKLQQASVIQKESKSSRLRTSLEMQMRNEAL